MKRTAKVRLVRRAPVAGVPPQKGEEPAPVLLKPAIDKETLAPILEKLRDRNELTDVERGWLVGVTPEQIETLVPKELRSEVRDSRQDAIKARFALDGKSENDLAKRIRM